MNKFKKYCPNVWVAECDGKYEKGDIIQLETRSGKEIDCEVYNFLLEKNGLYYYSIVRIEEQTYAERKVERHQNSVINNLKKVMSVMKNHKRAKIFFPLANR